MKFTQCFLSIRQRPDRAIIEPMWIERVIQDPVKEFVQEDGRIRMWGPFPSLRENIRG